MFIHYKKEVLAHILDCYDQYIQTWYEDHNDAPPVSIPDFVNNEYQEIINNRLYRLFRLVKRKRLNETESESSLSCEPMCRTNVLICALTRPAVGWGDVRNVCSMVCVWRGRVCIPVSTPRTCS